MIYQELWLFDHMGSKGHTVQEVRVLRITVLYTCLLRSHIVFTHFLKSESIYIAIAFAWRTFNTISDLCNLKSYDVFCSG